MQKIKSIFNHCVTPFLYTYEVSYEGCGCMPPGISLFGVLGLGVLLSHLPKYSLASGDLIIEPSW